MTGAGDQITGFHDQDSNNCVGTYGEVLMFVACTVDTQHGVDWCRKHCKLWQKLFVEALIVGSLYFQGSSFNVGADSSSIFFSIIPIYNSNIP